MSIIEIDDRIAVLSVLADSLNRLIDESTECTGQSARNESANFATEKRLALN